MGRNKGGEGGGNLKQENGEGRRRSEGKKWWRMFVQLGVRNFPGSTPFNSRFVLPVKKVGNYTLVTLLQEGRRGRNQEKGGGIRNGTRQ